MRRDALRALRLILGLSRDVDLPRSIGLALISLMDSMSPLRALFVGVAVGGAATGNLAQVFIGAAGVGFLSAAYGIGNLVGMSMGLVLAEKASVELDRRVMHLTDEIATLDPFERPEFKNRLELVRSAAGTVSNALRTVIMGFVTVARLVFVFFVLAKLHPALMLLPAFALPSVWAAGKASRIRHEAGLASAEEVRLAGHFFGLPVSVHAAKELRVFGLQDEVLRRHRITWDGILAKRRRAEAKAALLTAVGWLIFGVAFVTGIWIVGRRVVQGDGSPGDVAAVLLIGGELTGYIAASAAVFGSFSGQIRSMSHYLWLMDYAEDASRSADGDQPVPSRLSQGIRFESVAFRYPSGDSDVLSGVDLDLPAGSTVAVVGDNGAGKTTLVKLLCGFYSPTSGRILVDGVPLDQFSIKEWRTRLSGAFQDYARFEFLAREVVGVGDLPRVGEEEVIRGALAKAGASDVPDSLGNGLDTQLGRTFGGQDLSGGQWQKLALARAMMRDNPLVLVLDEPTASLDAETEHALFERYAGAAREAARQTGAITLLVSHRFTTVRMADLIVVIDGGRVAEYGSHEELMSRRGAYAQLFQLQARGYSR